MRYADVARSCCARLELVGLDPDVLGRYPIELSGGMKQRMVMVISTLLDPSLLIADEVTSALDVSTQKAVAKALAGFRDRGFVKSMIFITHDISLTYQIADTIMVMYAGKLAEKAPAAAIVSKPRHPYTQAADQLAAGGRRPVHRPAAVRHPRQPAVAAQAARRLPLPGPLPAGVRRSAPRSRRSTEVEPGHFVACWKA